MKCQQTLILWHLVPRELVMQKVNVMCSITFAYRPWNVLFCDLRSTYSLNASNCITLMENAILMPSPISFGSCVQISLHWYNLEVWAIISTKCLHRRIENSYLDLEEETICDRKLCLKFNGNIHTHWLTGISVYFHPTIH